MFAPEKTLSFLKSAGFQDSFAGLPLSTSNSSGTPWIPGCDLRLFVWKKF